MNKLAFGVIQLKVGLNKAENVARAITKIRNAKSLGAQLIALPECFNSPYGVNFFPQYAESIPDGDTSKSLSDISKELGIFLIAGSIPEIKDDKLFNTSTIWGPQGNLLATYRKLHLFDIDIPGEITFKESDALSAGSHLNLIEINGFKIGIGICYDIRFEELAKLYRLKGCNMLVYPGAFNMKTGPLHWELLARSRSNDNQCFTALISPARDENAQYVAFGHSCLVDPWGKVVKSLSKDEDIFVVEIDLAEVDKVRTNIPIFKQRRTDIYDTVEK